MTREEAIKVVVNVATKRAPHDRATLKAAVAVLDEPVKVAAKKKAAK